MTNVAKAYGLDEIMKDNFGDTVSGEITIHQCRH